MVKDSGVGYTITYDQKYGLYGLYGLYGILL